MKNEITIDCPRCAVRIRANAVGSIQTSEPDELYVLVQCHTCKTPLFGSCLLVNDEFGFTGWDTATRLWPSPALMSLDLEIPERARRDIEEAQKCLTHGIYSAAAVLCGRALERLIKEKAGSMTLAKGLQELRDKSIIDQRLYDWANALRKERNIGAHASEEEITRENAQDVIDFTVAIFEYVYTLSEKYVRYMSRKKRLSGGELAEE